MSVRKEHETDAIEEIGRHPLTSLLDDYFGERFASDFNSLPVIIVIVLFRRFWKGEDALRCEVLRKIIFRSATA
jgi:hypothetical protein